jgi:hypothetical protein
MQGEYRGDFTRDSASQRQFLRVLMQQGRVQLDADWNEQADILLNYLRQLGQDLIGYHGGRGDGFRIGLIDGEEDDFAIAPGRYYVEGLPCEQAGTGTLDDNNTPIPWTYRNQPYQTVAAAPSLPELRGPNRDGLLLVYLDVWERHISLIEDFDANRPGIGEVALEGVDTATRSQLIWQVKVVPAMPIDEEDRNQNLLYDADIDEALEDVDAENVIERLRIRLKLLARDSFRSYLQGAEVDLKPGVGTLQARTKPAAGDTDPCRIAPKARYRGLENRLYRVEIIGLGDNNQLQFAWSRHNSSVTFPILRATFGDGTATIALEHLGRDARYSLTEGDWVELVNDDWALNGHDRPFMRVSSIDTYDRSIVLEGSLSRSFSTADQHPYLRRWDSPSLQGVSRPADNQGWLALEDGIEILFNSLPQTGTPSEDNPSRDAEAQQSLYQVGDYWLIPARTATGNIEWPRTGPNEPWPLPPHGIAHYYAPLAILSVGDSAATQVSDCRRQLTSFWT